MSRPKHWFYGNVVAICKQYPELVKRNAKDPNDLSEQERKDMEAVGAAFSKYYIANDEDSNEIYFCATERYLYGNSFERIGEMCWLCEKSIQRRVWKFNNTVAENLGYLRADK